MSAYEWAIEGNLSLISRSSIMTHRTLIFALISGLMLGAGACSSMLEPIGSAVTQQDGVGLGTPSRDDNGGLTGGQGVDDPAGDDRGGLTAGQGADDPAGDDRGGINGGHGADDPPGDDHGGNHGGQGHRGADDPANHE